MSKDEKTYGAQLKEIAKRQERIEKDKHDRWFKKNVMPVLTKKASLGKFVGYIDRSSMYNEYEYIQSNSDMIKQICTDNNIQFTHCWLNKGCYAFGFTYGEPHTK